MSNFTISEPVVSLIIRNIEDQLNIKKMALIALQKEIGDLETLKNGILQSPKDQSMHPK